MASEYGYDTGGGSVLGGGMELLKAINEQHQINQGERDKQAALPFLQATLSKYLGGQQIPNLMALQQLGKSRDEFSQAGNLDADANLRGAEADRTTRMTPGMVEGQSLENTSRDQENQIRAGSLQDLIAKPGVENVAAMERARYENSETQANAARLPFIAPEAQAGINRTNAETGLENTQAQGAGIENQLRLPEFGLKARAEDYNESDPYGIKQGEGDFSRARAKNMDAETAMYSGAGGGGQAGGSIGADPKMAAFAQALQQHLTGGNTQSQGQDAQNPQPSNPHSTNFWDNLAGGGMYGSPQKSPEDVAGESEVSSRNDALAQVKQLLAQPSASGQIGQQGKAASQQVAARVKQLADLRNTIEALSQQPNVDPASLQNYIQQYTQLTQALQGGK